MIASAVILQDKLEICLEHIMEKINDDIDPADKVKVTVDSLVIGALQEAFIEMVSLT